MCCEHLCGIDVDVIFSYSTPKYVTIVDRRLGILKWIFSAAILLYVFVIQIWQQGGYLISDNINGYSRFTIQQPTVDSCNPKDQGCFNDFTPVGNLSYCLNSNLPYVNGNKLQCMYMDNIQVGTLLTDSMVVMTRAGTSYQELICDAGDGHIWGKEETNVDIASLDEPCPLIFNTTKKTPNYYVADVDSYTILIDHGVLAPKLDIEGEAKFYDGMIEVKENDQLCAREESAVDKIINGKKVNSAPCYIAPMKNNQNLDYFTLKLILESAGRSLDDPNSAGETYRESGATLILSIEYKNFWEFSGVGNIRYVYSAKLLDGSEYQEYKTTYDSTMRNRTVINSHGINIKVILCGSLYAFSFNQFLLQLTTSLTLIVIANTIVDTLALTCLPDKEQYNKLKYEVSEDFSDLRERARSTMDQGNKEDKRHNSTAKDKVETCSSSDDKDLENASTPLLKNV